MLNSKIIIFLLYDLLMLADWTQAPFIILILFKYCTAWDYKLSIFKVWSARISQEISIYLGILRSFRFLHLWIFSFKTIIAISSVLPILLSMLTVILL